MPCVFNWFQDSLTSQVHPLFCLPHNGNHTWLGKACKVRIGIEAYDRFVVWSDVAAQDAMQDLSACSVAFGNGILKQFDKGISDLNTVLAEASFCARAGTDLDRDLA